MYFFSLKEVLHSPYIGDGGIEGIGVDFGVFPHRGAQVYILIFEPLQELYCSVQSFAPGVQVLKLIAHLTWVVSVCISLSVDCPRAYPSRNPPRVINRMMKASAMLAFLRLLFCSLFIFRDIFLKYSKSD